MRDQAASPLVVHPLWQRLSEFRVGTGSEEFTFTDRLANENGWLLEFAERVQAEYLRFLFLGATCDHPVTPSDQVDQCWHLHLLYTESYWTDLCGEVLGRPFHHGPTRGGVAARATYHEQYERTLASYERAFGVAPPADVWPAPGRRFANAHRFERLNRADVFVLPRPRARTALYLGIPALLLACAPVVSGAVQADGMNPLQLILLFFLALLIFKLLVALIRVPTARRKYRETHSGNVDGFWGYYALGFFESGDGTGHSGSDGDGDSGCGGGCGGGGGGD